MDRHPLVLLQWLKFRGVARRMGRNLTSPKGLFLTALGLVIFIPQIAAVFLSTGTIGAGLIRGAEIIGPWILLLITIVTIATSGAERAIVFSPPEIGFLFPAPFSRRALLLYKVGGQLALSMLTSVFMTFLIGGAAASFLSGYVGLVLIFGFMTLLTAAISLISAVIGEVARTWRRRLALVILAVLAASVLASSLREFSTLPFLEVVRRINDSPVTRAILTPFRWFILTMTAPRIWPDLLRWGTLAFLIDAALLGVVVLLDAQYLEMAAANSERVYAKIEQLRRGGIGSIRPTVAGKGGPRRELPMLPWFAGAGPIAWRQLTSALRDWARPLVYLLEMLLIAGLGVYLFHENRRNDVMIQYSFAGIILAQTLIFSVLMTFDFRSDVDRIDTLKALPISPISIVAGQLATPCALGTILQWLAFAILGIGAGASDPLFWALAAFIPPFNVLLFEAENVMFLWFPSRMGPPAPGDLQALGRGMLLMMAKFLLVFVAVAVAGGIGALAYSLFGLGIALIAAWICMSLLCVALIPLVAHAFKQFDVARDTPP